jgi:hypothetical protein
MRIQALELPAPEGEHSFALIVDQATGDEISIEERQFLADRLGAKVVLVFSGTVELA